MEFRGEFFCTQKRPDTVLKAEIHICNQCNQENTDIPLHILITCQLTLLNREVLIDCVAIYLPFQILIDINSMCKEELLLNFTKTV